MIIHPHLDSFDRVWRFQGDAYTMILDRLCWARDNFECEVDLRGIAAPNSDGVFEWAFIRAIVGPKNDVGVRPPLNYPGLRFEHERVPLTEFMARLEQNGVGTKLFNGGEPDPVINIAIGDLCAIANRAGGWSVMSEGTGGRICSFPNWQASSGLTKRIAPPFVSSSPNHAFYPDSNAVFEDLSGMNVVIPRDERLTSINIVVVDQRGQVQALDVSEDGLFATLGGNRLADLTIQLRHSHGVWTGPAAPKVCLPKLHPPSRLDLVLVSPEHEIVDRHRWNVFPVPDENQLNDLILGGENQCVEFKPWTEFKGEKFNEIVDAAIAMANGDVGGTILIGVDDYGRSASWKVMSDFEAIARAGGVKFSDQLAMRFAAAESYGLKLVDRLGELMTPVPPVRRGIHEYHGGVVLRLDVSPAPIMVMHRLSNRVLVRRGASNREPSREQLHMLTRRGQ